MGATVTLEGAAVAAAVRRALGDAAAVPTGWAVRSIYAPHRGHDGGRLPGGRHRRAAGPHGGLVARPQGGGAAPHADARGGLGRRAARGARVRLRAAGGPPGRPDRPAVLRRRGRGARGRRGGEGADDPAGGAVRLWLEDLAAGGAQSPPFTPAQYRRLARGLGALAGAYLGPRPLPAHPWLQRGDARQEHRRGRPPPGRAGGAARRPPDPGRLAPGRPGARPGRVRQAPALLGALEALPHSLCHQDAVPRNLFVRPAGAHGPEAAVAIDWAKVGLGPVGRDLAYLIAGGVHAFDVAPAALPAVEAAALEGYLEGLADQGWRGAARDVRLGYLLSVGLRYGLLTAPLMLTGDAQRRAQVARSFGRPLEELAAVFREEQRFCLDRLDEARALLRAGPG